MRGKVLVIVADRACDGITPAYAGKSSELSLSRMNHRDHPRVCGEKIKLKFDNDVDKGSPPRMRGKGME